MNAFEPSPPDRQRRQDTGAPQTPSPAAWPQPIEALGAQEARPKLEEASSQAAQTQLAPSEFLPELGFGLGVGLSATAVFGALWLLSMLLNPGLVAIGAGLCTAAQAVSVVRRVREAGDSLGWEIRDEHDLSLARRVVEADMKGSAILMARLLAVLGFCLASNLPLVGLGLVVFCVPFGPWASAIENRFRSMKAHEPALAARFGRIAEAWQQPRWKLPPDV